MHVINPIPTFYFNSVKNVGDLVTLDLVSGLFGSEAFLAPQDDMHLLAVGSMMGCANQNSRIWGTGVIHPSVAIPEISGRHVFALRGKLSWRVMRQRGIGVADIALGDPAYLIKRFFRAEPQQRRYPFGIVPHYVDQNNPWVQRAIANPSVLNLDVHLDPQHFIERMTMCDTIVSSSLHGLIFAEALGIPNLWVEFSDQVVGEGFKFRDWFSLAETPQNEPVRPTSEHTIEGLASRGILHGMQIDEEYLIECFPYSL
jgi:hypothetical protein